MLQLARIFHPLKVVRFTKLATGGAPVVRVRFGSAYVGAFVIPATFDRLPIVRTVRIK